MAAVLKRISDEPAYVLHRYDWSESSLILEVFTRHHGRIALGPRALKNQVPPSGLFYCHFKPFKLPMVVMLIFEH